MDNKHLIEEQPKTLQDYLQIILFHKWKVITISIVIFTFAILKLIFSVPTFQASAVVMVEEEGQMQTMFDFQNPGGDKVISNEIEIVKSRHIAERLVDKVANSPYRDNLYILGTRKYTSSAIEFKKEVKGTIKSILPFLGNNKKPLTNNGIVNQQAIVHAIIKSNLIEIANRRETNILDISFKSIDSLESIYLTNQFVEAYQQADVAWSSEEISNLNSFLEEQLSQSQAELTAAENQLRNYQEQSSVFGVDAEVQPLLEQATRAETELTNTETSIKIALETKSYLEIQFSEEEKELADKISNSIESKLDALRQQLGFKEAELINTRSQNAGHYAIKGLEQEIANIRKELEDETNNMIQNGISVANPLEYSQELLERVLALEAELSGLEAKKVELQKSVRTYNQRLSQLPDKQLQYIRFERNRKVLDENYIFLRTKMEEAKIKKASESGKIRIIDRATTATQIAPNKKQDLLLGLVLGLGLGIGFVLLLDFMDNTIRTIDDIERTGLTLMGAVPFIGKETDKSNKKKQKRSKQKTNTEIHESIITHFDPKSPIAEAYRGIRTNINLSTIDEDLKTVLVSSAGPGEGKTTTISNLSITFAKLGKKTLIVDCDLRKPKIHQVFGLHNRPGLINVFDDDIVDPLKYIHEIEHVENLSVLTSGGIPSNPSELLGSKKMQTIIEKLKDNYDVVLFDSPPFTAVTDPVMLAKVVDRILIVVKAGETHKKAFYRSIHNLNQVGIKPSGIILNWFAKNTSHDAYYYYQNYYHYYMDDGSKKKKRRRF